MQNGKVDITFTTDVYVRPSMCVLSRSVADCLVGACLYGVACATWNGLHSTAQHSTLKHVLSVIQWSCTYIVRAVEPLTKEPPSNEDTLC